MSSKSEVSCMFNEDICQAMLKFFKTQPGRLTTNRKSEFQQYVLGEVENGACYFMITSLEMMRKCDITKYVSGISGEFYDGNFKQGKEKLASIIKNHLAESKTQ